MKKQTVLDLLSGIVIGLMLVLLCYIFWIGMGKEIERKEKVNQFYCDTYNYGYCVD